jgi:hypothetical protein
VISAIVSNKTCIFQYSIKRVSRCAVGLRRNAFEKTDKVSCNALQVVFDRKGQKFNYSKCL